MRPGPLQRTVRALFWLLATCAVYAALALPSTLVNIIFGSPV